MRFALLPLLILLSFCAPMIAGEDTPAELEKKAVAALKLSQTQPDSIAAAAVQCSKAADAYEKTGAAAKAGEMDAYLYWCKKKMTPQQIQSLLTAGDAAPDTVAKRLKSLERLPREA